MGASDVLFEFNYRSFQNLNSISLSLIFLKIISIKSNIRILLPFLAFFSRFWNLISNLVENRAKYSLISCLLLRIDLRSILNLLIYCIRIFWLDCSVNLFLTLLQTLYFCCWHVKGTLWILSCGGGHRKLSFRVEVVGLERILWGFLGLIPILRDILLISQCFMDFLRLRTWFL